MQIAKRIVDGVVILDLTGKMKLGEGHEELEDKIYELIGQGQRRILLNMRAQPYIDSAGLGAISRAWIRLSRIAGKLKLLAPTKGVRSLLNITALDRSIEIYDSEDEAIASFKT